MFNNSDEKYIASLDVGTTTIRCQIINSKAEMVAQANTDMKLLYPEYGFVEIDPDVLWQDIINVTKSAIAKANLKSDNISCMGIATQRATFITWRKSNGKRFHNFITWKDLRSKSLVEQWSNSLLFSMVKFVCLLLHFFTRKEQFRAGSKLTLTSTQALLRLLWVLQNNTELKQELNADNVMFGTLDTWLIHKLTNGKTYVTDYTNASGTGLFDPFALDWLTWPNLIGMKIPTHIFPKVVPNDYEFGSTAEDIFGTAIPIKCVVADQQASMFGSCCFSGDVLKITMGTGSFLDLQRDKPEGAGRGIYPLVFYDLNGEMRYMTEGACNDTGSLIQWALQIGLCNNPEDTSQIASSINNTDGVYFIPAFSGLGPPINDDKAASGFFGIKPTTRKEHLVRAILESIVFRIVLQYQFISKELHSSISKIYVDGGVSKNDFVCQMLADMTDLKVERALTSEMSVMGTAFIAGLNAGIWKDKETITSFRNIDVIFTPTTDEIVSEKLRLALTQWNNVVKRFKKWYI